MKKSLMVNCDNALILRDREDMLQKFDGIVINCDSFNISDVLYAQLMEKGVVVNCDKTTVISPPQNPVYVSGRVVLDEKSDYSGKYLVCKHLVAQPGSTNVLDAMEGLLVTGTLFHPRSMSASAFSTGMIGRFAAYPDGAELLFEDVRLDAASAPRWKSGTTYYVWGKAFALDQTELSRLERQNISFQCRTLYAYGPTPIVACDQMRVVPEGHTLVSSALPLIDLFATGGDKVYVDDDLTVSLSDAKNLERFASLIVKGTATVPLDYLTQAQAVMQADKISVFEGELLRVNSMQMMNHAAFAGAPQSGYTLWVNGALILEDDVTLEDIRAIKALNVNGAVLAPGALHGYLSGVAGRINGVLLGSISELKAMIEKAPEEAVKNIGGLLPGPALALLGLEKADSNATVVNCDDYALI